MDLLQAIFLGILQGITEFLPISSSGHLKLAQALMGLDNLDQYVIFDLVCHAGTLCAICWIMFKEIRSLFTTERTLLGMLFIGLLPLFPLYFILKQIEAVYALPEYLGFFFLITATLLYTAECVAPRQLATATPSVVKYSFKDAFYIGCAQAAAIFPAISRSGATIATARLRGWSHSQAARFSFLLAIPTILGGIAVKTLQIATGKASVGALEPAVLLAGGLTSFLIGALVLKVFLKLLSKLSLKPFAYYCAFLGIVALLLL